MPGKWMMTRQQSEANRVMKISRDNNTAQAPTQTNFFFKSTFVESFQEKNSKVKGLTVV